MAFPRSYRGLPIRRDARIVKILEQLLHITLGAGLNPAGATQLWSVEVEVEVEVEVGCGLWLDCRLPAACAAVDGGMVSKVARTAPQISG